MSLDLVNLKSMVLTHCDHHVIPSLFGLEEPELFEKYKIDLPRPIYASGYPPPYPDLSTNRADKHKKYIVTIERFKSMYRLSQRKKAVRKFAKKNCQPNVVCRFAELLEKDPDTFFAGDYDWYLTGGNLEVMQENDDCYVLHCTGPKLDNLVISKIDNKSSELKKLHQFNIEEEHIDLDPQIYETQSLYNSENHWFTTRRRDLISIYSLTTATDKVKHISSIKSNEVPFISSALNPNNSNELVTSNVHDIVQFWDIEISTKKAKKVIFKQTPDDKPRNCNIVKYYDKNTYAFASKNQFGLLDTRQSNKQNQSSVNALGNLLECENITSMVVSQTPSLMYLASYHKIFSMDVRSLKQKSFPKINSRTCCNHQLQMSPVMLKSLKREDNEFLLLSSHINGDMRLYDYLKSPTHGQPVLGSLEKIRTFSETLGIVKMSGRCLDSGLDLEKRKTISPSGIALMEHSGKAKLLYSMCNGDIFSQEICLVDDFAPNEFEIIENWDTFFNNMKKQRKRKLYVNKVENLLSVKKIFNCKKIDDLEVYDIKGEERAPKWKKSVQQLQKYKDNLTATLLSVWEFEKDELLPKSDLINAEEETNTNQRISEWLESCTAFNNSQSFLHSTVDERKMEAES